MKRNIALVAHDSRKEELIAWVTINSELLLKHNLFATCTTAKQIEDIYLMDWENKTDFHCPVKYPFKGHITSLLSGPLGGDQQIGAMIATGEIDVLIFFCDNLIQQGLQQNISELSRLASLYNIGFATNCITADMLLSSTLFESEKLIRRLPPIIEKYENRFNEPKIGNNSIKFKV